MNNNAAKIIVISGADSAYSRLLSGLLASIENHARTDKIDIGIFDLGLDGVFKIVSRGAGSQSSRPIGTIR